MTVREIGLRGTSPLRMQRDKVTARCAAIPAQVALSSRASEPYLQGHLQE
jgi:hypothetical protein